MVNLNVLGSAKLFFSEWEDSRKYFSLFFLITIFFLVLLVWIKTNIPTIAYQADIFLGFTFVGIIFAAIDYIKKDNGLFGFLFIGKNLTTTLIAFVVGCFIAALFFINQFAIISTPMSAVSISTTLSAFIFVVLVAPYVEELFFRMSLYPTIIASLEKNVGKFNAGVIATLFVCVAFAFFHFAVFNAGFGLMISAFLFSLIAIIGNRVTESSYFGFGLHLTNNFLAIGGIAFLLTML